MIAAPLPPDEATRLQTLDALKILDTPADPVLDGLVRSAARVIGCPIGLISLIDARRQWFKARLGVEATQGPRVLALCAHAILGNELFEVPDASLDPRFADHPLVSGEAHMRFYAGVPLDVDGHKIGTLCVIDRQPRHLSDVQRGVLCDLARAVEHWMLSWRQHQALRARESDFRQLAEQTPAIVYRYEFEAPHRTLYVSPRVAELGFTPERWIADPDAWFRSVHPDDLDRVMGEVAAGLAAGDEFQLEYRLRDAAGAWRHYRDVARVVRPEDGRAAYLQGVMLDITARVAAESTLRDTEAYRRTLFEQLGDGVFVLDTAHRILDVNAQGLGLLGYAQGELIGRRLHEVLAEHEHQRLDDEVPVMMAGAPHLAEWEHVRKDGSHFPAEVSARPLDERRYLAVVRDISQRHAQEKDLRQLSLAVEQSSESIVITNLAGSIEYVNAAAVASSGYARAELLGCNARILQSGKTPAETYRALWASLRAGQSWQGLLFNRRKDGSEYVESAVITPVRRPDGRITQYLAVKEDVTEKRRMSEELDRHRHHLEEEVARRTAELALAKQAAEAANAAKSTFLATMSHEIRTPMNGVVGIVDVLRQSSLTPYQSDLADTIRESAFALLGIIDDILDFSKIEAGRLVLEPEPVALLRLVEQVCDGLQPVAASRGVGLQVFVDPRLPDWIGSDAVRLRQILNNLLGNAIKFSAGLERPGRVWLRVDADADGRLRLQVIDNGIGMALEAQQRIFQPFVQAEGSTTRRYGGTGLGLSICRRLVELFDGSIEVASVAGEGATFTVTLPLRVERGPAALPPMHDLAGLDCHVVLRDAVQARDWCVYLDAAGAQARAWPDLPALRQALEPDVGAQPVLIVEADAADAQVESGVLAPAGRLLPQVLIGRGQRRSARVLGPARVSLDADAMHRAALVHAVAMACGRAVAELNEACAVLPVGSQPPSPDEAAAQGRLVLVAEDNEINRKVISRQLALLGIAAEVAEDGLEALERWRGGLPERRYGLLLTDLHMPAMDGYELTTTIRAEEPPGERLPIVALSANALRGEAERCRAAGMDDYLGKPVQLEQLGATLARWLPLAGAHAPAAVVVEGEGEAGDGAALPVLDAGALARLIGDDADLVAEFRRDYIVSAHAAAAELRTAAAKADAAGAAAVAHRLKSSSRAVGALALGACCEQIEAAGKAGEGAAIGALLARFEAALALAAIALAGPAHADAPASAPVAEAGVLLVDDEAFQRQVLQRQLAVLGVAPVHAYNSGALALDWLNQRDSSALLLLLDLNMPGMDGVEVMRHLAERGYAGALALVSGTDTRVLETAAKLAQAYQLNVLSHLHKPVPTDDLRALIARWRGFIPAQARQQRKAYGPQEIRRAIEGGELVLQYQPKVALADGAWVGVEALVRWQHPGDGLLQPDSFVAVAEAHGLIDALTRSVLAQALAQARRWRDAGLALRVAVNVSMDNLARLDFPEFVIDEVARHGVPPTDLVLEVTESRLMRDARAPMDILTRLRLKQIGLSIDDFGTGHSSLAQLRDIPFDELKIDRGFVHGSREHATQRAIFSASLGMAHQLGMTAVAEGVEDRADWDFVRAAGCDLAQGFFVARPMPADALPAWAAQWRQRFEAL